MNYMLFKIAAEMDNFTVGGRTVPPDVVNISQKPDIIYTSEYINVFWNVPFESNIEHMRGNTT